MATAGRSLPRQENAHGQPLVGAPKTDADKRTIVLPKQPLIDNREHLATWAAPGLTASSSSASRDRRCGSRCGRRSGTGPGDAWDSTTSTPRSSPVSGALAAATGAGTKELMYRPRLSPGRPPLPARHEGTRHRHRRRQGVHDAGGAARSRRRGDSPAEARTDPAVTQEVRPLGHARFGRPHGPSEKSLTRAFARAGDENRTRVLSLGS